MTTILGLSAYYHDSAACLVVDGRIVAAAQEERFSRKKFDASFPEQAIRYCLSVGGTSYLDRIDAVAFYDKPLLKLHRILETFLAVAPRGLRQFMHAMPTWLKDKIWLGATIPAELAKCGVREIGDLYFIEHHRSHAAAAFYPSPFRDAAVVTLDGVGEWATSSIGDGDGATIRICSGQEFPHSLGLLYSAMTGFCGFRVNSGEYKLMGLAPYGEPRYVSQILDELIDVKEDGSFRLAMEYFGWHEGETMYGSRFAERFGGPPRAPEGPITRRELDLARSIQDVTEMIVLRTVRHARSLTGRRNLCLGGGVALNCVANGRVLREKIFDDLWVQPAAGDAGSAIGAALEVWHGILGHPREPEKGQDAMGGALLGPGFTDEQIERYLRAEGLPFERLDADSRAGRIAALLAEGRIVAVVQGRMEFGPRALGNRSILGDPRSPTMQSVMNRKIKFRESFRPFAPAVLEEKAHEVFELDRPSPYMMLVAHVAKEQRRTDEGDHSELSVIDRVNRVRSEVPAVTHVDYSARIQTVNRATNPQFYAILAAFYEQTGCPVLVNTSFNVRGEPIVCTPEDGYRCFRGTEIDDLVLGSFLLRKEAQPPWSGVAALNLED